MNCPYCREPFTADGYGCCSRCGAPKPKQEPIEKYDPFFYDGYIVYSLRNPEYMLYEFVFYKGMTLCGRVKIGRDEMMANVKPFEDYMPYVMQRLEEELVNA